MQCRISFLKHVNKALLWLEILPQMPREPGKRQRSHAHCLLFVFVKGPTPSVESLVFQLKPLPSWLLAGSLSGWVGLVGAGEGRATQALAS